MQRRKTPGQVVPGCCVESRNTPGQLVPPCPSHLFHLSQKPWNFASPPDTLSGMHKIIEIFADRAALHTEILALRQQVAVLKRQRPRPSLRKADRVFWVILSCLWPGWRHALVIVRPETVIGWHRKGFRLFWTWKSRRRKPGRPPVSRQIRHLVRRMSRENTRWGAPRIHGELLKLGFSDIPHIPSKFVEIVPLSHRQGNCIPYAAIRWHDFGNRPALGRPLGHFSRHPDTPLLSLSPRRRFPRPTPERVFVADHQSSSGFSGTGPSAPPPQPIGT